MLFLQVHLEDGDAIDCVLNQVGGTKVGDVL